MKGEGKERGIEEGEKRRAVLTSVEATRSVTDLVDGGQGSRIIK